MVFKKEERLDEGEDKVKNVDNDEDVTLASGGIFCLKVWGDVEPIQRHTANGESWGEKIVSCCLVFNVPWRAGDTRLSLVALVK